MSMKQELMCRWNIIDRELEKIDSSLNRRTTLIVSWNRVMWILKSLPLTTDDFGTCSNELQNARTYVLENELGAARFEIRLLKLRVRDAHRRFGS